MHQMHQKIKKQYLWCFTLYCPEILRGQNYTKAADIYSFGIIMYEVISGLPPYHDASHDKNLATKIFMDLDQGLILKYPINCAFNQKMFRCKSIKSTKSSMILDK